MDEQGQHGIAWYCTVATTLLVDCTCTCTCKLLKHLPTKQITPEKSQWRRIWKNEQENHSVTRQKLHGEKKGERSNQMHEHACIAA